MTLMKSGGGIFWTQTINPHSGNEYEEDFIMLQKQIGEKVEGATTVAKCITFRYDERDYILEFTRQSVKEMERQGFVAADVIDKPTTMLPALFAGAFLARHRHTKQKLIDAIYAQIDEKAELLDALCRMYSAVIEAFLDELTTSNNGFKWKRE